MNNPSQKKSEIFKHSGDPVAVFLKWFEMAEKQEINDPGAMCLATASADGKPSARMVLLKGVDERGFKFHTNSNSQKGHEINANQHVALCFHWKSLRKQVRIEGTISEAGAKEADRYFADRPRARQIGAWASDQSAPLESREFLEEQIQGFEEKFIGKAVPRPAYWRGYIVYPEKIEFWYDNPDRLHDRFVFTRDKDGEWVEPVRLYP